MPYAPRVCPQCGHEMDGRSRCCRACYGFKKAARGESPRSYSRSKPRWRWPNLPWLEPDRDYSRVDPVWFAAFAGFFLGEGYIDVQRCNRGQQYGPILSILIRADDRAILDEIARVLGGNVIYRSRNGLNGHPAVLWEVGGLRRIQVLCQMFLAVPLPGKKLDDVRLVGEWIAWRLSQPMYWTDEMRRVSQDFHDRIKTGRVFKEPSGQVISA